ncbi:MAG: hypothetical protein JSW39_30110 [Desulfobacterales bacterium]|nr:MAG: hypothetical protein JSW39_30110 [Desulfobacterales bacterium]
MRTIRRHFTQPPLNAMTNSAQEVAWNGIRFPAPGDWEVSPVGICHLLLEDAEGPALEIKWGLIKGNFSHQAHLKKLAALLGKQPGRALKECSLPRDWQTALSDFEVSGFSWEAQAAGGRGVILFCPVCRRATLIQFFHRRPVPVPEIASCILANFQDHPPDSQIRWAIFDIRATVPETFQLVRYRFEAGKFELAFAAGPQRIALHRWGLASVCLNGRNLTQFAKTQAQFSEGKPWAVTPGGYPGLEWSLSPPTRWRWWWNPLRSKPSHQWYRLWHLKEKNRILGVRAEGHRAFDRQLLDGICARYESI